MQQTVYYLTHKDTHMRLGYYRTLAGARIAQRARNRRLGFIERIERVEQFDNWEVEMCKDSNDQIVAATYCIVEGTLDSEDYFE